MSNVFIDVVKPLTNSHPFAVLRDLISGSFGWGGGKEDRIRARKQAASMGPARILWSDKQGLGNDDRLKRSFPLFCSESLVASSSGGSVP